jgi:hypothetical protein
VTRIEAELVAAPLARDRELLAVAPLLRSVELTGVDQAGRASTPA